MGEPPPPPLQKYDYTSALERLQKLVDEVSSRIPGSAERPTYFQQLGVKWRHNWTSIATLVMIYSTTGTAIVSAFYAEEQRKVTSTIGTVVVLAMASQTAADAAAQCLTITISPKPSVYF